MAFVFTTFTFSTLYGIQHAQAKRTLEILDHISIYFLMVLHSVLLMYMPNSFGITLLSVLWGLTALGIIYKIFYRKMEIFLR
jgi:hemolysin III